MARWDVGSFNHTSVGTTVSHAAGAGSNTIVLGLSGSTAAADTTANLRSVLGLGFGIYAGTVPFFPGVGAAFAGYMQNSTAQVETTFASLWSVGSSGRTFSSLQLQTRSPNSAGFSVSGASTSPTIPYGFAVIDGSEQIGAIKTTVISTAGTTQASSGLGIGDLNPNAVLLVSQSHGSSIGNMSVGFACKDTANNITQWSIDQSGREIAAASGSEVRKSASTASVVKLHSTATTHHDVSVTSFRTSGVELTVNARDTARSANLAVLYLNVPKAHAGKATITTDGAGSGQTGFTVSGIGQQVGLVILASIGSSLQTLQADNMFSLGFASSNGSQRSVAGMAVDNEVASSRYGSFFATTAAVTFVTGSSLAGGIVTTTPPWVVSRGVYSLETASSGFKVTFNNTAANGWDVYWAALSNVIVDIEAHILSSGSISANVAEVARLSAAIQMEFGLSAKLEPDFEIGTGVLKALSEVLVEASIEDDRIHGIVQNSSSPALARLIDITTTPQRIGVAGFGNTKFVAIHPPSTNTYPYRVAAARTSPGVQASSRGPFAFSMEENAGQDIYLSCTAGSIPGTRVLIL